MIEIFLLILALLLIAIGYAIRKHSAKKASVAPLIQPMQYQQKPILLMIIDTLMEKPLKEAMNTGRAPALKFLSDQGKLYPNLVTTFPTMSVSIDATLLTGTPPNQHRIFGLNYFHPEEKRIINLGTGAREAIAIGPKRVLTDSLSKLNQQLLHPKTKTIHEELDLPTASINALIYRGNYQHRLTVPWLIRQFVGLPKEIQTKGPKIFSLGALAKINHATSFDTFWLRYGQNDRFTAEELIFLIEKQSLPPFTIIYLPSNDDQVHRKGIDQVNGIEQVDRQIQKVLNSFSSWKEAVDQATFIVIGDSGQTDTLADHKEAFVDMKKVLHPYRLTSLKKGIPEKNDQLVCCVNERMTYLYLLQDDLRIAEVVNTLQQDERFDLIAWKEEGTIHVVSGTKKGIVQFSPGGELIDEYGQTWTIEGNLAILDVTIENQQITYGIYPDVFYRLQGVSEAGERLIIVTVSPGYEMILESSPKHRGASHGSLYYSDSYVPMIVSDPKSKPKHLRLIDLKTWIVDRLTNESR